MSGPQYTDAYAPFGPYGGTMIVQVPGRHAQDEPTQAFTAVQVAGRDTVTFPAIRDDQDACHCGMCPGGNPDEKGALLSCGPGVVSKMWRTRVRNGEWEDIRAMFGEARRRIADAADKGLCAIHNNLDCDWHDIAAVFRADTELLDDPELAEGLARFEAELSEKAAGLRRWVAERAEAIRAEAETRAA